jgi:type II secretory pathway pseudopilin PulG
MHRRQSGFTLVVLLVILGIAGVLLAARLAEGVSDQERAQRELAVMGQIRDALIARAAADESRPGSLPCPDMDNDGIADGSTCTSPYVGRLPWKTLDLPEPRDASGEPFWYAISMPYRDTSAAGALNSDTAGTLTLNDAGGNPVASDVVAVIFAPRAPLSGQNRNPSDAASLIHRSNYREGENATSAGADTLFQHQVETNTFNDFALPITRAMLMRAVEHRVARQARRCLMDYAAAQGHLPFAAPMADTANYLEQSGLLYGRVPKTVLAGAWPDDRLQIPTSGSSWTGTEQCFGASLWWDNWRELLLYRVASPNTQLPTGSCPADCLFVNGSSSAEAVVIVAGKALTSPVNQTFRSTNKTLPQYYLEAISGINNATGLASSRTFAKAATAASFNDRLECIGAPAACN